MHRKTGELRVDTGRLFFQFPCLVAIRSKVNTKSNAKYLALHLFWSMRRQYSRNFIDPEIHVWLPGHTQDIIYASALLNGDLTLCQKLCGIVKNDYPQALPAAETVAAIFDSASR
jgi:hypothetical protein